MLHFFYVVFQFTDCQSGLCAQAICSDGEIDSFCDSNRDCDSGRCELTDTSKADPQAEIATIGIATAGLSCDVGSDCYYNTLMKNPRVCKAQIRTMECNDGEFQKCDEDSDCESEKCVLRHAKKFCAWQNSTGPLHCWCDGVAFNGQCASGRCDQYKCKAKMADGETGCGENSDCLSGKCWNKATSYGTCGYDDNSGKRLENNDRCNQSSDCKNDR